MIAENPNFAVAEQFASKPLKSEQLVAFAARVVNNPWFKIGAGVAMAMLLNSFDHGLSAMGNSHHAAAQTQTPYDFCNQEGLECSASPQGFLVNKHEGVILDINSLFKSLGVNYCPDPKVWNLNSLAASQDNFAITGTGQIEACGKEINQAEFFKGLDTAVDAFERTRLPAEELSKPWSATTKIIVASTAALLGGIYGILSSLFMEKHGKKMSDYIQFKD